jgi:hypothetical protein
MIVRATRWLRGRPTSNRGSFVGLYLFLASGLMWSPVSRLVVFLAAALVTLAFGARTEARRG